MSMITELIVRLRNTADKFEKSGWGVDGLIKDYREAAFVIEELSEKLKAVNRDDAPFDGMTNGEKFKEVFRISQVDEGELDAFVWLPNHDAIAISIEWWNAPYNAESEEAEWLK